MHTAKHLSTTLSRIDGAGYKAYKEIQGVYAFPRWQLIIDHVQGDPYSTPTKVRVRVTRPNAGFPPDTTSNKSRTIALCDFIMRIFFKNCRNYSMGDRGIGKSGLITTATPVQEIIERSAVMIDEAYVELRFFMGLPAFGRKIAGKHAHSMFFDELPQIVDRSLFMDAMDRQTLYHHITTSEDADHMRNQLKHLGLIGFVANGAHLPRQSGIDPKPLADDGSVIPFQTPQSMRVDIALPNSGTISGMGLFKGVTLIVGGGYHGKSTLLKALELGIYNHIPGDGRERVVTLPQSVKIRAADGRNIEKTDISPFITDLPFHRSTTAFSTANASGSTSQAAAISEAIEAGAQVLLLDEDTSATNFMIRDFRMQQLVAKAHEPITPFVDKIKSLYREKGISTILVMGGCGDYFSVADRVIQMAEYIPYDVTEKAAEITRMHPNERKNESGSAFGNVTERIPMPESIDPIRADRRFKIASRGLHEILFGDGIIDLWDVEQIIDAAQTQAIGYAIDRAKKYTDGKLTLQAILTLIERDLDEKGLDILPPYITGDLARFRPQELSAALNRMRTLIMRQKK